MASHETQSTLEEYTAPPIPPRNPLRNNPVYQAKRRSFQAVLEDQVTVSSSVVSQDIYEEIDRELKDTHQRLVSALYLERSEVNGDISKTSKRHSSEGIGIGVTYKARSDADNTPHASTSSSGLTQGLKRYSAYLGRGKSPILENKDDEKQRQIKEAMARMRNASASLATISSYNDVTETTPEDDARTEAWLERGLTVDPPQAWLDLQFTLDPLPTFDDPFTDPSEPTQADNKPPRLSLFPLPPTSPTSGIRKFASPLSPMNNGRDAYGNYIPTNTRDYVTAQSPPTSPPSSPVLRGESQTLQISGSVPRMRGGGGWWQSRTGQQSTDIDPTMLPMGSGSPVQKSLDKGVTRDYESSRQSPDSDSETSRGSSEYTIGAKGKEATAIENIPRARTEVPARAAPRTPPMEPIRESDGALDELDLLWGPKKSPNILSRANAGRPESPMSEASFAPRTDKRWHNGPTAPPGARVLPPLPYPIRVDSSSGPYTTTQTASNFNTNPYDGHPALRPRPSQNTRKAVPPSSTERQPARPSSSLDSIDDDVFDIQSLAVGESVSQAGFGRRPVARAPIPRPQAVAPRQGVEPTRQQIEAWQANANTRYKQRAQELNAPHNEEIMRLDRAALLHQISDEQYRRQIGQLSKDHDRNLAKAKRETGYDILENEAAIIEAIKTAGSYATPRDVPIPARSDVWGLFGEQPQAIDFASTIPIATAIKPPKSSLNQGRQMLGRIARFILATPSDPDLKTFSNRRPSQLQNTNSTTHRKAPTAIPTISVLTSWTGATLTPSNARWTGTTSTSPPPRPARPVSPSLLPSSQNPALRRTSGITHATVETHQTLFPRINEEHNVYWPHEEARMRGGGSVRGKKRDKEREKERGREEKDRAKEEKDKVREAKKKTKEREKRMWMSAEHSEALHYLC